MTQSSPYSSQHVYGKPLNRKRGAGPARGSGVVGYGVGEGAKRKGGSKGRKGTQTRHAARSGPGRHAPLNLVSRGALSLYIWPHSRRTAYVLRIGLDRAVRAARGHTTCDACETGENCKFMFVNTSNMCTGLIYVCGSCRG